MKSGLPRSFAFFALVLCCLSVIGTSGLSAPPPGAISYQGRLTTAGGTPVTDGSYILSFAIYSSSGSSTALWNSGDVNVTVAGGLFSIALGQSPMPAFPANLWNDSSRYLGVSISGEPESVPRIRLLATPYAYSAHFATENVSKKGDVMSGSLSFESDGIWGLDMGSSATGGYLNVHDPGDLVTIGLFGGNTGDASVQLLPNAINSQETSNEPGIASNALGTFTDLSSTMATDIATVTITTPDSGYITVDGKYYAITGSTLNAAVGYVQIDENSGGSANLTYATLFGADDFPSTSVRYYPGYVTRVYHKVAPGTFTFRMEGGNVSTSTGALIRVMFPTLRATYYPTSYGTVTTMMSE